jgi:hypothetical protein
MEREENRTADTVYHENEKKYMHVCTREAGVTLKPDHRRHTQHRSGRISESKINMIGNILIT